MGVYVDSIYERRNYFGIFPEKPRLQHIGKKGTTANKFSNERNENLGFTDLEEVN